MLLLLASLLCSFAHRGRGRKNYRTEEDKRETRRRLAGQRDPRRAETSLTYEESEIFRDLVLKKGYDEKQEDNDIFQNVILGSIIF